MMRHPDTPKLVFATNNRHKFEELQHSLGGQVELVSLKDIGFTGEIPEEQDTVEGNAVQKAQFIYQHFGVNCIADDTGLEIDALDGEPGVYSARYAGENCTFEDNLKLVLKKMTGKTNRKARFKTVIALMEQGQLSTFMGEIRGLITEAKRGSLGFGYDPIFEPEGWNKTFAEMTLEEKNKISHRGLAVEAFIKYFKKVLNR
jgi:XTP/dITP diphosphohydrolase